MLKFKPVLDQGDYDEWKGFADSFGHGVDSPTMPIVMIYQGDKLFAYYHILQQPIILPAFHPEKTTPRNFRDALEAVSHHMCMSSISQQYPNGVMFLGIPTDNKTVPESMRSKLGLEALDTELYRRLP